MSLRCLIAANSHLQKTQYRLKWITCRRIERKISLGYFDLYKKIAPGLPDTIFIKFYKIVNVSFVGHPDRRIHSGAFFRGVQPEFVRILQTVLPKVLL